MARMQGIVSQPAFAPMWLNNTFNSIPIRTLQPTSPNMLANYDPYNAASFLTQPPAMQMAPTNICSRIDGRFPLEGYKNLDGMPLLPPTNLLPYLPMEHTVTMSSKVLPGNQHQEMRQSKHEIQPETSTTAKHSLQETVSQKTPDGSENRHDVAAAEGISKHQAVANANLELAKRLSESLSTPFKLEENVSYSVGLNDFPPLK